jgi:hypothetical protein
MKYFNFLLVLVFGLILNAREIDSTLPGDHRDSSLANINFLRQSNGGSCTSCKYRLGDETNPPKGEINSRDGEKTTGKK